MTPKVLNAGMNSIPLEERLAGATLQTDYLRVLLRQLTISEEEYASLRKELMDEFIRFKVTLKTDDSNVATKVYAKELIRQTANRAALAGAIVSAPVPLPGFGLLVGYTLRVGALSYFTIKMQLDLVFKLAALYDYPWQGEELRSIAFVLVGLSDYDRIKEYAAKQGVRISVRKFTARLAGQVLVELMAYDAAGVVGSLMVRTIGTSFVTAGTAFAAGSGVGAYFAHRSISLLGKRAYYFFNVDEE